MRGRVATNAMVMAALIVALPLVLPRAVPSAAAGSPAPLFSLSALLSIAPDLPAVSKRVMVGEAERIWKREGVRLRWTATRGQLPPNAALRVLVIERREAVRSDDAAEWTVGELVPHAGRRALAIASIAGAERVLAQASSRAPSLLDAPELAQHRLGVVLGRAVAHEIGHFLLATATHADRGLMRAIIDAQEFADPGARTFALDDTAGAWLRQRLSQTDGSPPGSFTYTADR